LGSTPFQSTPGAFQRKAGVFHLSGFATGGGWFLSREKCLGGGGIGEKREKSGENRPGVLKTARVSPKNPMDLRKTVEVLRKTPKDLPKILEHLGKRLKVSLERADPFRKTLERFRQRPKGFRQSLEHFWKTLERFWQTLEPFPRAFDRFRETLERFSRTLEGLRETPERLRRPPERFAGILSPLAAWPDRRVAKRHTPSLPNDLWPWHSWRERCLLRAC